MADSKSKKKLRCVFRLDSAEFFVLGRKGGSRFLDVNIFNILIFGGGGGKGIAQR